MSATFGLVAGAAAYSEGRDRLAGVMALLGENRPLVESHLPGVGCLEPDRTYLAWLEFTDHGIDDPAAFFPEEAKVALTGRGPFGVGGRGPRPPQPRHTSPDPH